MPRDGSGNYTKPVNSVAPAVPLTTISSADFNTLETDIATELTDSLCRSGKGAMLANIAAGGFKFTGLGAPVAANDSARLTDVPTFFTQSGDVTTSGSNVTTVAKIQTVTVTGVTGTGKVVFDTGAAMVGLQAGSHPATPNIGQVITAVVGATSMTTAVVKTITSVALTAGNWLLFGTFLATATTTTMTRIEGQISTIDNSFAADAGTTFVYVDLSSTTFAGIPTGTAVVSISGSATYYLTHRVTFSGGGVNSGGRLTAIRIS